MSEKIVILVGTMSGNAELAAEEMADRFEDLGADATVRHTDKATIETFRSARAVLICTSTYGTGEVPDNAKPLFDTLTGERPDLSGIRYGVFTLGDSIYPQTFCFGGLKFDEILTALGAVRVSDVLCHDTRKEGSADEIAGDWAETWLQALEATE